MIRIIIRLFIWDEWNLSHIGKHNISKDEVEGAKEVVYHRRTYGGKYLITARSGSRLITMILRRKGVGEYYVVTARDSSRKERKRIYEKIKK